MSLEQLEGSEGQKSKSGQKQRMQILDSFGRNLTRLAALGELEEAIGREDEIERLIQILTRKTKNNSVLVGEPGVGKCFTVDTKVTIRNDYSGEIVDVSIKDLLESFSISKL